MYQNRLPQRCSSTSQDVPAVLPRYPGWRWRSVVLAGALGCGMSLAAAQTVLLDGATGPATAVRVSLSRHVWLSCLDRP